MNQDELLALCECSRCPIAAAGHRRPVMGAGPDNAKMIFLGESPGVQEVRVGRPFIGPSGQLLDKVLAISGMKRENVYTTNATLCVLPGGKTPLAAIRACKPRLKAEIDAINPLVVAPLGATAVQALEINATSISDVQGGLFWEESLLGGDGRWIAPSYHPAFILRQPTAFTSLRDAIKRAVRAVLTDEWPEKEIVYDWEHVSKDQPNADQRAVEILREICVGDWGHELSFDVETGSTNQRSQLIQVAIANADRAVVFDAEVFQGGEEEELLYECFTSPRMTWMGHNISFDLQHLYRNFHLHHTDFKGTLVDTMMLALGTTEQGARIGLKPLAREYFAAPRYEEEIHRYLKHKNTPFTAIPRSVLAKYAAADVIYTRRLYPLLAREARRVGTYDLCMNLLTDAQKMFADLEYDGVAIDLSQVRVLREEWVPRIREQLAAIQLWCKRHGWDGSWGINPDSPQQMEHFFYDLNRLRAPQTTDLNSKGQRKRKTGKEWRELYAENAIWGELAQMLEEYKSSTKLLRTYVDGIARTVNHETGRVHPSFKPWGAVTGRVTIENPPLQTIPRKSTDDKFGSTRALFISRKRRPEKFGPQPLDLEWPEDEPIVFIAADYNALETRMMWFLSQDPVMGADLLAGDFHRMTAARIFTIGPDQVTYEQRHNSKYVTFGIGYGRDVYSLALGQFKKKGRSHQENIAEATFFRDRWKETYSTFWAYRESRWETAQATGKMITPFGRIRRFPLKFESGSKEWKDLRNQSYNFDYQSTASDLNLQAAVQVNREIRQRGWGRVLYIVHDSIEAEVRLSKVPETIQLLKDVMLTLPPQMESYPHPPDFELGIEIEVGKSWGHGVEWSPDLDLEALLAA